MLLRRSSFGTAAGAASGTRAPNCSMPDAGSTQVAGRSMEEVIGRGWTLRSIGPTQRCLPNVREASAARTLFPFGPELTEEAAIVRADMLLHQTPIVVENKNIAQVPLHLLPVGWKGTSG